MDVYLKSNVNRFGIAGATNGRGFMKRGFTLVELLVVITIIGILASLISVAAVNAVYQGRQMRIKVEVDQLDAAMKEFKVKYNAFPPCNLVIDTGSNPNLPLKQFISRAFPRYNQTNLIADLQTAGVDTTQFNPAAALVFWLSGFSPDVTRPFTNADGTAYTGTRVPIYGFDKTRLLIANGTGAGTAALPNTQPGNMVYVPSGGQNVPIIYFDNRVYTTNSANPQPANPNSWSTQPTWLSGTTPGTPTPYVLDQNGDGALTAVTDSWCNADSVQIISAGQDGKYGAVALKLFPRGTNYTADDNDNVTNFCDRASLEDARP